MSALQHILLATDFRPASVRAAEIAIELAWAFGSRVSLLHVLEPMPTWPVSLHQQREWATTLLNEVSDKLVAGKARLGETAIEMGPAADVIVRYAQTTEADMILLGSGDKLALGRYVPGSVAEAVIEHATQPVMTVRPDRPTATFQKILCPVDQSDVSHRALRNAIRLANAFRGQLTVLSVAPKVRWLSVAASVPAEKWFTADVNDEMAKASVKHANSWQADFDRWLEHVNFKGIAWAKETREGKPAEEIVAAAERHGCDLIVMGATGRSGLARALIGSVTRRVLRALPCSLLTVKDEDVVDELHEEEVGAINVLFAEGQTLAREKSYEAAVSKFNRVLAYNPFHIPALYERADACEALGQIERARRCRQRADILRAAS